MDELSATYSRADAVADGVLIDVSEAARAVDISVPVFMTVGLWQSPYIQCQMERVCLVLNMGMLRHEINFRIFGKPLAPVIHKSFSEVFFVRFHLEPSEEFGVVVTVIDEAERLTYDMPRTAAGGSYFVV